MKNHRWLTLFVLSVMMLVGCGIATTEVVTLTEAVVAESPAEEISTPETPTEEAFNVVVTDGLGNEIALTSKPMRIISLTLGTDEILLAMVGPERLIGVTYLASDATTSNIVEQPELARVENVVEADPEQIIALEPDLVFAGTFTDAAVLDQIMGAGIPVFAVGFFTSIEAMQDNILVIGQTVGESSRAEDMVAEMDARLQQIADVVSEAGSEKPTVLYLAPDGWVAGSGTTVDDIIARAGGINAAASLVDWNQVSPEVIIELDPDVVILSPYVTDGEFQNNPAFANLGAIVNGRVYPITDAHMSATSQYLVLGVEDVAHVLYPELFNE